jgi:hypothetical protein
VVHAGLGQHGVVLDLGLPVRNREGKQYLLLRSISGEQNKLIVENLHTFPFSNCVCMYNYVLTASMATLNFIRSFHFQEFYLGL